MNTILIFTYPLAILLVLVLIIGLGVYLTRKFKLGWRLFWIGGALFILSQVLHIPFNIAIDRLFDRGILPLPPEEFQLIFSALFLGLSAGLFEELTRYAGYRWWAKDARNWSQGLLFGAGWGGMEAIIFYVVVMLLNYIIFMALRTVDLTSMLPPEQLIPLQQGLDLFWGVAWYDSMLGALERMLVLPIQMALSVMVLQVFTRGQSRWLWFAVGWHALLDAAAVLGVRQLGAYATEGIIAVFTLLSIGIIFLLRGKDVEPMPEELESSGNDDPEPIDLQPIEENIETIDDTRYSE